MTESSPEAYVCGQITGLDEEEYRKNFSEACALVESHGYKAVNPLEVIPDCERGCNSALKFSNGDYQHTWQCYMKYDIIALLNCDAIFVQKNAIYSKGATLELEIARKLGLWILTSEDGKELDS